MSQSSFVDEAVRGWSALRPDANLLGLSIGQRLLWSGRLAEDLLERAAVASGLRHRGDYEVLTLLRAAEPAHLTPLDVAQQLMTSQSGMTGKLDRLEQQGLIQRTPDPTDRRAIRLGITDAGRAVTDEAFTKSLLGYEAMLERFTPAELNDLITLLGKLLARLDELSGVRKPWGPD